MSLTSYQKGLRAETFAKLWFRCKGYRILAERYKTPSGEIDLIAKKSRVLVFVEVKLRKTKQAAAEAIHSKNRSRVTTAAALYLQCHPEYSKLEMRFDALVLSPAAWPQHICNAW
jgi:putative endonuclease